jgi:hypothetical protein
VDPFDSDADAARVARIVRTIAFVASAAIAAAALRFAFDEPAIAAVVLSAALAFVGARWVARRRLIRILRSGDVRTLLQRWSPALRRVPHPGTMAPLMTATAFAACGWVDKARAALATAERGPAWEAALEHRLFLETLLDAFEGDREGALDHAKRLERLPPPPAAGVLRERILTLRAATAALARAFAHRSQPGDAALLERAGEISPLVFWAMRYAAAVVAIDEGDLPRVHGLLADAPAWPEESTFKAFHEEIADRAGVDRPTEA